MIISNNILKHCLKHVYFINGTAYAGKSTMVRMLAEKHDMIHCGENYHAALAEKAATPDKQPNLCYFRTMKSWQEFIHRTPEEYARWIDGASAEAGEIEIAELLRLSASGRKIIVDTNISIENLHEISDYDHVAIMLSPQSMSVDRFFDRDDADKQFILRQIQAAENPKQTMDNYRACIARINSAECFHKLEHSGFFTVYRDNAAEDTRSEVLSILERHFKLSPAD